MDTMVVLNTMIKLFLILILGYLITKIGIINQDTNKTMSSLVVNVSLPAIIIASVCNQVGQGSLKEVMNFFLLGIVVYLLLPIIAYTCCKLLGIPKQQMGTYQYMLIFTNCSFMGYPVLAAIFGNKAIFLSSIFNLPFNLLAFTYGILLISKDGEKNASFEWKKLLNPGIIASFLALAIYGLDIQIPTVVADTCNLVGGLTTPLSMIVLGASLAEVPIKEIFGEKKIYPMVFLRLIGIPIIFYVCLKTIIHNSMLLGIATMTLAMPVASMSVMLSHQYDGNTKLASIGVFITTLCSVISIPFIAWLLFH